MLLPGPVVTVQQAERVCPADSPTRLKAPDLPVQSVSLRLSWVSGKNEPLLLIHSLIFSSIDPVPHTVLEIVRVLK